MKKDDNEKSILEFKSGKQIITHSWILSLHTKGERLQIRKNDNKENI